MTVHTHTRELSSFEILLGVEWNFLTDVSGQFIGPIFKVQGLVLDYFTDEDGADRLSRNVAKKVLLYVE